MLDYLLLNSVLLLIVVTSNMKMSADNLQTFFFTHRTVLLKEQGPGSEYILLPPS